MLPKAAARFCRGKRTWTAFSIRASSGRTDFTRLLLVLALALVAGSCARSQQDFGIRLTDLDASGTSSSLSVRARHDIRLSSEAREALENGVPLRVKVDLSVRESGSWSKTNSEALAWEIRYLPLSNHYQLTGPTPDSTPRTYPRLRHVLAELRDFEWRIRDINAHPGNYEIRMRSHLDRSGMPGPMQLPMLFSTEWAHDSGWISHDFSVRG